MRQAAERLLKEIDPSWVDLESVLKTLPIEDQAELSYSVRSLEDINRFVPEMLEGRLAESDEKRILKELICLSKEIGFLEYEKAFWVIIPTDINKLSMRIEASGGENMPDFLRMVTIPNQVTFSPSDEEQYELLSAFRNAKWVLHAHNHPYDSKATEQECLEPSEADLAFSVGWKYRRKELSDKMKFFIIHGHCALEYSMFGNKTKRWDLNEPRSP